MRRINRRWFGAKKKKRKIKQNRENKKFLKKRSWQRGVCQRYLKGAREKRMKNKFNIKQIHKYIKNEYMNINIKQIYIYILKKNYILCM